MEDIYLLEWTFKPRDFFEQEIRRVIMGASVWISEGTIEARITPSVFESETDIEIGIHEHLVRMFAGVQLVAKRPFELSDPVTTRIHPDGRKCFFVKPNDVMILSEVSRPDIVITHADGTRIDSKAERLELKRELADRIAQHGGDPHLSMMLASFQRAMVDKNNTLIHLYEVLDALSEKFGGPKDAIQTLSIPQKWWSDLGRLANHEPLKEGRHRGRMILTLRPAAGAELDQCKSIAADLISRYVEFLESKG